MNASSVRAGMLASMGCVVIACTGAPQSSPTPDPSAPPTVSVTPSATAAPTPPAIVTPSATVAATQRRYPALVETYTSSIHGITVAHPAGWRIRPASQPWTGDLVFQLSPYADVIYLRDDDTPFIALASQALAGRDGYEWAADYLGKFADECNGTAPVAVDGAPGLRGVACQIAMVSIQDQGYLIWLYRIWDEDYFNELLATVQLMPDAAATP